MLKRLYVAGTIAALAAAPHISSCSDENPNRLWVAADPDVECAQAVEKQLCAELLSLGDNDQFIRHKLLDSPKDSALLAEMSNVDAENLSRVTAIIDRVGWPGKAMVGRRAAGAAWVIVQHADLATQEKLVDLMQKAADAGELDPSLIALTVDRIRVGQHKPQLYGTQFHEVGGKLVPEPIDDPAHVDERRAQVGLQPLAEYAELMNHFYLFKQAPDTQPTPTPR